MLAGPFPCHGLGAEGPTRHCLRGGERRNCPITERARDLTWKELNCCDYLHWRADGTLATTSGVKIELSELLRIKSLSFVARNDRESAISCLTEGIEVARLQSALAFELRSAIDLARLLSDGEQRDEARHSLAPVYDRFTEGFQTADLKIARRLLENLQP
jgi:hypothetical protein